MPPASFHRISKALADELRFRLLEQIAGASPGELCCKELVELAGVTQATVSHHLKELVAAELIERRKDGQYAYFRLRAEVLQGYLEELARRTRSTSAVGGAP